VRCCPRTGKSTRSPPAAKAVVAHKHNDIAISTTIARSTKPLSRGPNESSPETRTSGLTICPSDQGPPTPPVKSLACNAVFGHR